MKNQRLIKRFKKMIQKTHNSIRKYHANNESYNKQRYIRRLIQLEAQLTQLK